MPLAPGTLLGSYQILAPLGAGGMGEVWRARDSRLGREVAIKSLPEAFARDPERLARFEREAQLLASLNHPNVGAIYGLEDAGGAPYLVLEFVEGETLAARLSRGALPLREALALCVQVAAAVEAAHERGIVHRDLKPGNVMIAPSGAAKVLDFGLAKSDAPVSVSPSESRSPTVAIAAGETLAGSIVGTLAYMSPEQARGLAVDRRSDLWAFGCVLYECLAGVPAFAGPTASDLIARILEREPDWAALPDATPPRVRDLLRRCLRKDMAERPRDIRDVRLELAEAHASGARAGSREGSVAVLPFENLSGPDDEYFADGVTEEIMNALAQIEGLRVAARTSCFAFKGRREDLRAVGEKLDVATVLEGSIRRAGARLRISAQLVNAADGYQLWSERYDRELTDVFEVQDEIAGAIARRLSVSLRGDAERTRARHGTKSLEAYELFLKGRALQIKRGRFMRQAMPCFERAIELDPEYADPLAWLADSYRLLGTFGAAPPDQVMPRAKELAARAQAIDPRHPHACGILADIAAQYEHDIARARQLWDCALEADPRHVWSLCERAVWATGFGAHTPDEAVEQARGAVAIDPLNAWVASMHVICLEHAGRHAEAVREAERAMSLDPESFMSNWTLMRALSSDGQYDRALALAPDLLAGSGRNIWVLGSLAWTYGKRGDRERARAVYDELEARSRLEYVGAFWMAAAAAAAGLQDEAMRLAARAAAQRDPLTVLARSYPAWDLIRADPRFEDAVSGAWS